MTGLNATLVTILRGLELSAHEEALLRDCARLRRVRAGKDLHRNASCYEDAGLLILISGSLSITRRPLKNEAARRASEEAVRIISNAAPVLVPPPRPTLLVQSRTEIEIIEFSDADCAFLLGTCRAFRALVFAAANAGVSQLAEGKNTAIPRAQRPVIPGLPTRFLH
ncbi:MAG: hypothetical protein AAF678_01745 [Pseudomonadota bacterium]